MNMYKAGQDAGLFQPIDSVVSPFQYSSIISLIHPYFLFANHQGFSQILLKPTPQLPPAPIKDIDTSTAVPASIPPPCLR